jgi:uncharacterized membrane protein YedE/YeeE
MIRSVTAFACGSFFGIGLGLAGMTQPDKVIAFLDLADQWDPSLAFVMLGAIAVHLVAYRLIVRRSSPILASEFFIPTRQDVDARLLLGAGTFGVGWALGGYCPGPGFVTVGAGFGQGLVFLVAMTVGMLALHAIDPSTRQDSSAVPGVVAEDAPASGLSK